MFFGVFFLVLEATAEGEACGQHLYLFTAMLANRVNTGLLSIMLGRVLLDRLCRMFVYYASNGTGHFDGLYDQ